MNGNQTRNNIYIKDLQKASIQHSSNTPQWVELCKFNKIVQKVTSRKSKDGRLSQGSDWRVGQVGRDGSASWRSGRLANLGMITTSRRGRASTRLVAGGMIRLRLAGRFTGRLNVFAFLSFVVFTFIAGSDLLRRVLTRCRVQPKPFLRLGNVIVIYFRSKDADVSALGDR